MKARLYAVWLVVLMVSLYPAWAGVPIGTAFSYQGFLKTTGTPATGNFDFQFSLLDAPTNGTQIGPTVTNFNVSVNAGLFNTAVDFGPGNFTGNALWLAVAARTNGGSGVFNSLWPLQPLTPTPNSLFARNNAQDTNALASIALLNSTITVATNNLQAMAYQPTNGPQFSFGVNYGPLIINPSGGLNNDAHVSWPGGADIWYNFGHSVEPELQFTSGGSVSWTIGEDGQGRSIGHFGGSGAYHSLWYMQYDDSGVVNYPGHSTPFGYILHVNQGTTQNYMFGYWMAEQDPGFNQTYRLNWHDYGGLPIYPGFHQSNFFTNDHVAGGLGSNTIYWGGAELTNAIVRGNTTIRTPAVQMVDFSYSSSDFLILNALENLTLAVTNLNYTNKTLVKEITIHSASALVPIVLSVPANWITLTNTPAATNLVPNAIPKGNDLNIRLVAQCGATTNIYATYAYAWNPAPSDPNALNFFAAVGGGLTGTELNAVNLFALAAKTHGYWNNLAAFYPFVGGTSNSCSWNLVNSNLYRIAWHGSTATNFAPSGIYGNGSSFYGDPTGLVPATALASYTSSSVGVWIRSPAAPKNGYLYGVNGSNGMHWGALAGGPDLNNFFYDVGLNFNNSPGGGLIYDTASNYVGVLAQNLKSPTVEQRYLNGKPVGGTAALAVGLPAQRDVYILALNISVATFYSDANLTGFYVAQNMTDQNMSDLISDWTALNNNLGR